MQDELGRAILAVVACVVVGLTLRMRRLQEVAFVDEREERLTRRLAQLVRSSLAQALTAMRKELELAPGQSDETLIKRAAYHYRQELPEPSCGGYRDRAPG
jgi:hypothetical protein